MISNMMSRMKSMLHKVRHHSSYSEIHDKKGESMARLDEIEVHLKEPGRRRESQLDYTGLD